MSWEPIVTDRLIVRQAVLSDAEALHQRRNDPEAAAFQNWVLPFPIERARSIVEGTASMSGPANDEWWMGTVTLPDGEIVGDVAVRLEFDARIAEIGYTFAREHWGKGFATEASEAVVGWLFEALEVSRISAMTHPENVASVMVLERLGFSFEGHSRQSYWVGDQVSDDWIFGLLREDWEQWRSRLGPPQSVTLVEIDAENAFHVLSLKTHKSQERFVAPMAASFTDALFPEEWDGGPASPWLRAVEADGELVGFVMLATPNEFHKEPYLWRLLIDRRHQRRNIGSRVLDLVVEECKGFGATHLNTSWVPGRGSPEPFYVRYGFEPTGRIIDDEVEGRLEL